MYGQYHFKWESNRLAEEIGEALQKVASTAENSGVSLEKTASWIKFSPLSQ